MNTSPRPGTARLAPCATRIEPLETRIAPAFITGTVNLAGLNGTTGTEFGGAVAGDYAGGSVSAAGDVNGDGFGDFLIGASRVDSGNGAAYVIFGTAAGFPAEATLNATFLNGTKGFRLLGQPTALGGEQAGYSVGAAGDVNGDGFDDVIVGARSADPNGNGSGAAYVVFGKAGGFAATVPLASLDGSNGFKLSGAAASDRAGHSVSGAGDVNGDGFDDVIVGAYNLGGKGAAFIIYGKAGGFAPNLTLSGLTAAQGVQLDGVASGDRAGRAVSGAGDVNGDGFADVVVGADGAGTNDRGAAYVVFGGNALPATIALGGIGGSTGFRAEGAADNDYAGTSVGAAGDVNGDGLADVIVGASGAGAGGNFASPGEAYVIFGNTLPFGPVFPLGTTGGTIAFTGAAGDVAGFSVKGAGDVNGDGIDDLIVGAPQVTVSGGTGGAYVVFGRANLATTPPLLSALDGSNGFQLVGEEAASQTGVTVSGAGDVNGDGFTDLLVGAKFSDDGGTNIGKAYLVLGGPSGAAINPTITAGKTATWTDVDGDLVTLKVSKGTLTNANFQLIQPGAAPRAQLLALTLGAGFDGADVSITAKRAGGGDGRVNVGFINATGVDLGKVTVAGDLGRIVAGDADDGIALKSFTIGSLGNFGGRTGDTGTGLASQIIGPVGAVKIAGDVNEAGFVVVSAATAGSGSIASVTIGGSLIGGDKRGSGQVITSESLGPVKIAGDLRGGAAPFSGYIEVGTKLASVTVGGSLLGAGGVQSGAISGVTTVGNVTIGGSQIGGSGAGSAYIGAGSRLGKVSIKGDQIGGTAGSSALIFTTAPGANIASVTISGDVRSGTVPFAGGILATGTLGPVTIGGDVIGTEDVPYLIRGAGPLTGTKSIAIAGVKVGGDFDHALVLGGYGGFNTPVNGHAQIGAISVGGDWIASSVSAGLLTNAGAGNANGIFGNGDDAFITAGAATNVASITSVTIKGAARGTFEDGDRFAIVAEQIGSVSIGGAKLPLTKSTGIDPANNLAAIPVGATPDFVVREVSRVTAAPAPTFTAPAAAGPRSAQPATIDLGTLASGDGFKVSGVAGGDRAGGAVSEAGDVNGDGFDDFIVGAVYSDEGGNNRGAAYVVFGRAGGLSSFTLSPLDGASGFKLQGTTDKDYAGSSVSAAGDVNGDGFDDLIVGAREADRPGAANGGAAYVVFGRSSFASGSLALSALDGTDGLKLLGGAQNDFAGFSVGGAGDVNGDGFDDVIVGAIGVERTGLDSRGAAYVIFGRQSFASAATPGFAIGLETLDGTDGFRLLGEAVGDTAGKSVSSAGDVNGDGFDDVLVGADSASPGDAAAYVVFGRPGFTGTPAAGFSIGLGTLQGTSGVKFTSAHLSTFATYAVGAAGDVNGDGFDDMIFGGEAADPGGVTNAGAAYVVFGKTSFTPGPVADFFIPLGGLNGADGFQVPGLVAQGNTGFSVDGAGDVNGDGFADLVVGVPYAPTLSGSAYVVFGRAGGFGATLSPATLDGANGFKLSGTGTNEFTGRSVSGAGDVNGDGFADVIVSAEGFEGGASGRGSAYVIYGGPSGEFIDPTISTDGKTATWTDVDGDAVTLKVTKGTLAEGNFQLLANSTTDPSARLLSLIVGSVAGTLSEFDGANVSLTAKRAGGGDGKVNVGFLNASSTDLGAVTISGDLGKIVAGDGDADPAVKSLTLGSFGVFGARTQDTGGLLDSSIAGPLGPVKIAGDLRDAQLSVFGTPDAAGTIASVTIAGSLSGGTKNLGASQVGNFFVGPGAIVASGAIGPVKIGGDLAGGGAQLSGSIQGAGIATLTLGGARHGGAGLFSGVVSSSVGNLGNVTIGGSQIGGSGVASANLQASFGGSIGKVSIKGDQIGGGFASALIFAAGAGNIASVTLGGDARGGDAAFSGGILAGGTLGPVSIKGDVIGTAEQAYLIRGGGPLTGTTSVAIASLKVGGDFERALILAGYGDNNAPTNGHAQIGAISVGGDWIASSVSAGLLPRAGALNAIGFFGNDDDRFIAAGPAGVIASIASITIKGRALGSLETGDFFGIVAEQIGSVTLGGVKVAFTAANKTDGFFVGPTPDFVVGETLRV